MYLVDPRQFADYKLLWFDIGSLDKDSNGWAVKQHRTQTWTERDEVP